MRLIFMGTPLFAVPALDALVGAGHEVAAVYSQPPRRAERGQKSHAGPVHVRASESGLTVRCPTTLKDADVQVEFAALRADVAIVAAYGLILPQAILDAPKRGCLNIHASLLPCWRGAAPIHRAIMAGDAETGISIMKMAAGLDCGPVLLRQPTSIGAGETTGEVHDRLADIGGALIVRALAEIDALVAQEQNQEGVTYAAKIDKAEAQIDWTRPAQEVDRLIRGLSPFPGAWTQAKGERIKFLRSRIADGGGQPGLVLRGLVIACGDGAIEVTQAQRPGKRPMAAVEFLRGWKLPDIL